jgi:hypothetical protein
MSPAGQHDGDFLQSIKKLKDPQLLLCLHSIIFLLVMQVAGVFWVAKKVSIFNSSILPSYFSSCSSLSATQDC